MEKTEAKETLATYQQAQPPEPCVFVIFGAGGDLTKRKLFPALYNLGLNGLLPKEFAIAGVAHTDLDTDSFRQRMRDEIHEFSQNSIDSELWDWLEQRTYYLKADFQDSDAYSQLQDMLSGLDDKYGTQGNYLYYLATPPRFFRDIIEHLGSLGLTQEEHNWRRVIIEKPFGYDFESAQSLNKDIHSVFAESQIYRIDHYLGKETVQNILVFRFGNGLFEPVWNHHYIDHVQITVAESVGVETRGGFYDDTGALRDMVPNHLFQLMSLTAMEPPLSFEADQMRDEKSKLLRSIQPPLPENVLNCAVRGQYDAGSIHDKPVSAYRDEPGVDDDSNTETFVAMKLTIDNWRWAGVPFYLRTGKALPEKYSEIAIQFRQVPHLLFRHTSCEELTPNFLVMRIQPNEGISLQFGAKVPGPVIKTGTVDMDFCYADYFGKAPSTGYETLLYDCMIGDMSLFQRADNIEIGWQIIEPILDVWKALPPRNFPNYGAGSWGPNESYELLSRDGRQWRKH
ncbi:MAG: glucose-6-phosphate dehydrogenase [Elainellaceae cyanobacterium]